MNTPMRFDELVRQLAELDLFDIAPLLDDALRTAVGERQPSMDLTVDGADCAVRAITNDGATFIINAMLHISDERDTTDYAVTVTGITTNGTATVTAIAQRDAAA